MLRWYRILQWMWAGLDWLYPPVCGGCDLVGYRWCPACQDRVVSVPTPICDVCGSPISNKQDNCNSCAVIHPPYVAFRAWSTFDGPVRQALHKIKYRRNITLGDALAHHMNPFLRSLGWPVQAIVPVPLGKKRYRERGYNQVGLVAMPLAAINGWEYLPRALTRTRETRSQVGLSAQERKGNVAGAFRADRVLVDGKTILLIDDVATTGSTLVECAQALLEGGSGDVYVITITRALAHHGLNAV